MKKLLLLGGSRYLIPVIEKAHELGIYVITCDYLPDNVAHRYSDEYRNISIIDKDAVLQMARNLKIDGVMSFACDPGVVTAAYVAEKMGLPFQCSHKAARILQDKGLFREFLINHGFNCPHAKRYTDLKEPFNDLDFFNWPVIVKPVDSAGSKGVSRVDTPEELEEAIKIALGESHSQSYIIEDFITFDGFHSSSDPFTVDGDLTFITSSDQLFDKDAENPYTPAYIIWPSSMKDSYQNELTKEIQRLLKLLDVKTGIYNIESCAGTDGKSYIMEVSPRGGGCKIAELQKLAFGIDLIEAEVKKAVGMSVNNIYQSQCTGYWCEMVVHANPGQVGKFKGVYINPEIESRYVRVVDIQIDKGAYVGPFSGANMALGDIFLEFKTREELDKIMEKSKEWLRIELED